MSAGDDVPPDDPGPKAESKRKQARRENNDEDETFYKPFLKPDYKRVFPENASEVEFVVFVQCINKDDKIGNRNPLVMVNLFKNEIKGVKNIKRMNAYKIGVIFAQAINANMFLKNEEWLRKNGMKAFIPANAVESIGVLRFVPTSISNEELFKKLSTKYEIIGVRRFTRKVNGEIKPYSSVSVTFLSKVLPDCAYLDIYRFKVHEYISPLLQCFKCFKFNHPAVVCNSTQICSICSEEHHFSACTNTSIQKCINCQGPHLAISRDCPVKKKKMEEKQMKRTYASVLNKPKNPIHNDFNQDFPKLPNNQRQTAPRQQTIRPGPKPNPEVQTPVANVNKAQKETTKTYNKTEKLIDEIIGSEYVLKGMVGALVTLGNSDNITSKKIQEALIQALKNG